jgi:uncharacterized protein (DUF2267 family)
MKATTTRRTIGKQMFSDEIAQRLGWPGETDIGFRAMLGVLHAMRDVLPLDLVFRFSSALPPHIRSLFFDGYNPDGIAQILYNQALLEEYEKRMGPRNAAYFEEFLEMQRNRLPEREEFLQMINGYSGLELRVNPEEAFRVVIDVLIRNGRGEKIHDVFLEIPQHLLDSTFPEPFLANAIE